MRRILVACMTVFALVCLSLPRIHAQDLQQEKQAIKLRHKTEWKTLKDRQKLMKKSMKLQPLPKAERIRLKHQMERERRELRERQKDEMEDVKDRQRALKESRANY